MKKITDISQIDLQGVYSYADYLTWQFKEWVELVRGKVMKPVFTTPRHQEISWKLTLAMGLFLKNYPCKSFAAPFDVRLVDARKQLNGDQDVETVVQPDICVVCDRAKIDRRGCVGAPDLVVEILSAGNSVREMEIKKDLYEENGVREYWVVNQNGLILQYILDENAKYPNPNVFSFNQTIESPIFPTMKISLSEIFGDEDFDF